MKDNYSKGRKPFKKALKGGDSQADDIIIDEVSKNEPVLGEYLEVKVFNNFEKAIRAFRAVVQKERILSLYKEKQSFEKPSDKRRRKRNEMKRKRLELESDNGSEPKVKKTFKKHSFKDTSPE